MIYNAFKVGVTIEVGILVETLPDDISELVLSSMNMQMLIEISLLLE